MKLKFLTFVSVMWLATIPAHSIRVTGTGGGESELLVLEMFPVIPSWLKACSENPGACGLPMGLIESLASLQPLKLLDFANAADGLYPCQGETLMVRHEPLYLADEKTPKSESEIAFEMLQTFAQCRGLSFATPVQKLNLLPWKAFQVGEELVFLKGESTDVAVATKTSASLHQEIRNQMKCESYRVLKVMPSQAEIQCLESGDHFLALVSGKGSALHVEVKYLSEPSEL